MSVNLPSQSRVIVIVAVVAVAFSTLAWSGETRLQPRTRSGQDTIPSAHRGQDRKAPKPRHQVEEGRVARELDLRIDAEEPDVRFGIAGDDLAGPLDLNINLDALSDLNERIETDVMNNLDGWKDLEGWKDLDEMNILGNDNMLMDQDALEDLKSVEIDEDALETLKEMKIDEDILDELRDLKTEMDGLRGEIESDMSGQADDYRVREEIRRVVEAVRSEMPRVRKEVERAMQSYRANQEKHWQ